MTYPLHTPGLHIRSRSITSSMLMTTYSNVVVSNDHKQSVSVAFQYVMPCRFYEARAFVFAKISNILRTTAECFINFHSAVVKFIYPDALIFYVRP